MAAILTPGKVAYPRFLKGAATRWATRVVFSAYSFVGLVTDFSDSKKCVSQRSSQRNWTHFSSIFGHISLATLSLQLQHSITYSPRQHWWKKSWKLLPRVTNHCFFFTGYLFAVVRFFRKKGENLQKMPDR